MVIKLLVTYILAKKSTMVSPLKLVVIRLAFCAISQIQKQLLTN